MGNGVTRADKNYTETKTGMADAETGAGLFSARDQSGADRPRRKVRNALDKEKILKYNKLDSTNSGLYTGLWKKYRINKQER